VNNQKVNIENRSLAFYVLIIFFSLPIGLLIHFLAYHKYALFAPEIIIIYLAHFIISLSIAGLVWRWRFMAFFFIIPLLILYLNTIIPIDQAAALSIKWLSLMFSQVPWLISKILRISVKLVIPFLLLLFLSSKMDKSGWRWLSVASCILLVAPAFLWATYKPFPHVQEINEEKIDERTDLPLFIYIIWDEHMSIKWTPEGVSHAKAAKQEMVNFYNKYDFLLFTNAFSHYSSTDKSISNVLNFSAEPGLKTIESKKGHKNLIYNEVFSILKRRGYDIRVYQSNNMNFCDPSNTSITFCFEYKYHNIGDIQALDIRVDQKALLVLGHWFDVVVFVPSTIRTVRGILTSILGEKIVKIPIIGVLYNRVGPINVKLALEQVKSDTFRFPRGKAFFAHLLIPHSPYVYDENNNLKKDPKTWLGNSYRYETKIRPTRKEQYEHYYAQVRGLYKELDDWFTELDKKGILEDATVIFHGDHGSRIFYEAPKPPALSHPKWERIVKDSYSTLFAVKDIGIPKGQVATPKSIETLLDEYFNEQEKLYVAKPESNFVYIKQSDGGLKKIPYDRW